MKFVYGFVEYGLHDIFCECSAFFCNANNE